MGEGRAWRMETECDHAAGGHFSTRLWTGQGGWCLMCHSLNWGRDGRLLQTRTQGSVLYMLNSGPPMTPGELARKVSVLESQAWREGQGQVEEPRLTGAPPP
jgi:hypothetical protein